MTTQLSELNAIIAQTVEEIDAFEAEVLAEIAQMPELIPAEEVERRMQQIARALWAKWSKLEVLMKAKADKADRKAIDETCREERNKLHAGLAEIRDRLKQHRLRPN